MEYVSLHVQTHYLSVETSCGPVSKSIFSVLPGSLYLCGESYVHQPHHRDTENTKGAQRLVEIGHDHHEQSLERFNLPRAVARMVSAYLLIVVSASIAMAIPLAEYRERVRRAVTAMESLTLLDEDEDYEAYDARQASTLRSVRQAIRPNETVQWDGNTIQVDNAWLDEALKDYEKLNTSDPRRTDRLARITERLYALDERKWYRGRQGSTK